MAIVTTKLRLETYNANTLAVGIRLTAQKLITGANPICKVIINWDEEGSTAVTTTFNNVASMNQIFTHTYAAAGIYHITFTIKEYIAAVGETPATEATALTHNLTLPLPLADNEVDARASCSLLTDAFASHTPIYSAHIPAAVQSSWPTITQDTPEEDLAGSFTLNFNVHTGGKGVILHRVYRAIGVVNDTTTLTSGFIDFTQSNDVAFIEDTKTTLNFSYVKAIYFIFDPRGFIDSVQFGEPILVAMPNFANAHQDTTATIRTPAGGIGGTVD